MPRRDEWTRDQLLIALRLYMRTPFGRLHSTNREIVTQAEKIGRSPSAQAGDHLNFRPMFDPIVPAPLARHRSSACVAGALGDPREAC